MVTGFGGTLVRKGGPTPGATHNLTGPVWTPRETQKDPEAERRDSDESFVDGNTGRRGVVSEYPTKDIRVGDLPGTLTRVSVKIPSHPT